MRKESNGENNKIYNTNDTEDWILTEKDELNQSLYKENNEDTNIETPIHNSILNTEIDKNNHEIVTIELTNIKYPVLIIEDDENENFDSPLYMHCTLYDFIEEHIKLGENVAELLIYALSHFFSKENPEESENNSLPTNDSFINWYEHY